METNKDINIPVMKLFKNYILNRLLEYIFHDFSLMRPSIPFCIDITVPPHSALPFFWGGGWKSAFLMWRELLV